MTQQLEKAVDNLKQLNTQEQNAIAALIEDELLWQLSLQHSNAKLINLAGEALKEHKEGKTKKGDW